MSEVKLFKKKGTYVDKTGKEKSYTNYYVQCGDTLVPIQVCYFEDEEGRDPQYAPRRAVLGAFAETLPERSATEVKSAKSKSKSTPSNSSTNNDDIPF